ncbi:MAG TPA: hypothetical protein VKK79_18010 [Candidatus Lokiarchaeia archaeon]|nr:hypothetical protein [Candidatus Lokiarchaeia archaeon]
MGFPSITLSKTAQRMIQGTFQEELEIINVISNTMRVIALKTAPKMTFLAEIQHGDTQGFSPIEISEKKMQTILKKQGNKLFLEESHPFIMFDMNGKILLSNVSNDLLLQQKSPMDCITLLKTGENAITQIFKEKFFAVLLCTFDHLYLVFSVGKDCVLMLFSHTDSPELNDMVEKLRKFVPFEEKEKREMGKVLRAVHSFQKRFV